MSQHEGRLRVATLNIWNTEGPYRDRFPLMIEAIQSINPDILCLQEVYDHPDFPQVVQFAEFLGYNFQAFTQATRIDGVPFGQATLAHKALEIVDAQTLGTVPYKETRVAGWLRVRTHDQTVLLANVHLTHRLEASVTRQHQVLALIDNARRLRSGSEAVILAGDFNAPEQSDEIRFLRGECALNNESCFYQDAYRLRNEDAGFTYCNANTFAAPAYEPDRRIDYIFVSQAEAKTGSYLVLDSGRFADQATDDVWPSDHFGVWADLAMSPV